MEIGTDKNIDNEKDIDTVKVTDKSVDNSINK